MMIVVKNKQAIKKMETAGFHLFTIFNELKELIQPGIDTAAIDAFIEQRQKQLGLVPRTKGYHGYRHASCISLNDEVVHGLPASDKIVKKGDLVKVDICASWNGYCADMARCFFIGDISNKYFHLVDVAQQALNAGIEMARSGNYLSDISYAIQRVVEKNNYGIVRDFAGHGIGKNIHEEPEILNYGRPGQGPVLLPGMTLALEPMITMGHYHVYISSDGWTVKTVDKSLAAHVEDTVLITENEPKILTRYN